MPADYLEKCRALANVAQFFDRPAPGDWGALEQELGVSFPSSHKQFVSSFGSGAFGGFILFNPVGKGPFRFSRSVLSEIKNTWAALPRLGFPIFPDQEGLVIVADTGANTCYALKPDGQKLGEDLYELYLSARSVTPLGIGVAEFLYKAYAGELGSDTRESIWGGYSKFFEAVEE